MKCHLPPTKYFKVQNALCLEGNLTESVCSLLNTYQGKRSYAFRPNSILNVYKGRGLRSLRPNSFLNVYDTAKPKRAESTPPLDSEDEGDAEDEQFVEGNQVRSDARFTRKFNTFKDLKRKSVSLLRENLGAPCKKLKYYIKI